MNGFKGQAKKLDPSDISSIASEMNVPVACLRAVMAVEASGSGFDAAGRPKALFERHHFYKWLKPQPEKLQLAINAGLAYPKWGEKPYPKGSDAVYDEIESAYEIDAEAALLSTSWGLGQVMGSNFKAAGADSVQEMVRQAIESESYQLKHMVNFIKNAGILDELQAKDWAGFAKKYNGPAYAENKYDVKLAEAYERFNA